MSSSKANAAEAITKFAALIDSSNILKKQEEVQKILIKTLKICREKLNTLETDEAVKVLYRIDPNYQKQLIQNIDEIFGEEVEKGKCILEEIDSNLIDLQTILESISQRLEEEYKKDIEIKSPPIVLTSYDDCRSIFTFLKLKTSILRNHLSIPFYEKTDPNPLFRCPDFSTVEEDDFYYLVSKLIAAHL